MKPRQSSHPSVGNAAATPLTLDDGALEHVHGGEVGQIAQSLRVYEFGIDPPRVACAWSSRIANEGYGEAWSGGDGDDDE